MKNVGKVDRLVRIGGAAAIIVAYLMGFIGGTLALVLGVVALVLLATGLFSTCPAYLPFGINTYRRG